MQQIVSSLVFQDARARPLSVVSPWIDARFGGPAAETYAALAAQTRRRFVKTHLPMDGLPLHQEVGYIHVARDGRDVAMSMHNHFSANQPATVANFGRIGMEDPTIGRPYPRLPADPAEYFRQWISTPAIAGQNDGLNSLSFFDLEVSYWAERRRANVLLVHYNDLSADLDGEMRRIANFLGIAVDEDVWRSLVDAARFETMRSVGDELMPRVKALIDGGTQRFFHKGAGGRWRTVLTDDDLALYDAKVREKFTPALAAWVEGGRLATVEPAAAAD
jgi:aryl sulfotransferase